MLKTAPLDGVFALDWTTTEIDGVTGLDPRWLRIGSSWLWRGAMLRLDGDPSVLPLRVGREQADLHHKARAIAQRLTGHVHLLPRLDDIRPAPTNGFVLTDGQTAYVARLVSANARKIVVFEGAMPAPGQVCWVTASEILRREPPQQAQDVICFAADAMIATPQGALPIAHVKVGQPILTRDNGPQTVLWVGKTTLSGIALRQHPHLRPVRLRCGAVQDGLPDEDLCVSPAHRILVSGARARALFGCDEVLARAADLVDYRTISPDIALHGVSYVHLLLESHQIIFANGLPTESFHPAFAPAQTLREHRHALRQISDRWIAAPESYGPTARRCLTTGEAALLAA